MYAGGRVSDRRKSRGKDAAGLTITSTVEKYVRPCTLGHVLALSHLIFATIIYYYSFSR